MMSSKVDFPDSLRKNVASAGICAEWADVWGISERLPQMGALAFTLRRWKQGPGLIL
jgi:hypothetical protein